MDRVLSGMRWSRCLVYMDDVISFGTDTREALSRLTEVLEHLSNFGLQLKGGVLWGVLKSQIPNYFTPQIPNP